MYSASPWSGPLFLSSRSLEKHIQQTYNTKESIKDSSLIALSIMNTRHNRSNDEATAISNSK